jgi:hypothetical protein
MNFFFLVFFSFFSLSSLIAEDSSPYLIPQTVFIGDRAVLVVPLGITGEDFAPKTLEPLEKLEKTDDLIIHRISLERKGGSAQIVIDFTAYRTGTLALPEIAGFEGFSGLTITVASLLTPSSMALSPPARPISAPGTAVLIYGSVIAVIVSLLLFVSVHIFGKNKLKSLIRRLFQQYLIIKMGIFIAKMRKIEGKWKEWGKSGEILDLLAAEFRKFLTRFTGVDCYAASAGEFISLPSKITFDAVLIDEHGFLLKKIFRHWDALRFSVDFNGESEETAGVFEEAQAFIGSLHPLFAEKRGKKNEF